MTSLTKCSAFAASENWCLIGRELSVESVSLKVVYFVQQSLKRESVSVLATQMILAQEVASHHTRDSEHERSVEQ